MKHRAAAFMLVVVAFASSIASARPFPPEPDFCATQFHPGPIATSCPFLYGGGRVFTFGAGSAEASSAGMTIEVVLDQGPREQVLYTCSAGGAGVDPVSLPGASCVRRSPVLPVADGTELRCRHRGPGTGVFGCLST